MSELLFMEPYFKDVLWGGNKMRDAYGYDIPTETTGEAWVVSGNAHGKSVVKNGQFKGQTLDVVFKEHPELFGNIDSKEFPLLIKIIDAQDNLSVQVHPDDAYANEFENGSKGKTECWYILDCDPDAEIIVGHNAKTKEELVKMIDEGKWDELLNRFPIHKGDFFYIPSGTVHAICKGTLILETQQNSDLTYRLYDYDRLQNGKPRELHLKKSEDVINCPYVPDQEKYTWTQKDGYKETELAKSKFFTVDMYDIDGKLTLENNEKFLICDVIEGSGTVNGIEVTAGDNFVAPYQSGPLNFEGKMQVVTSHV